MLSNKLMLKNNFGCFMLERLNTAPREIEVQNVGLYSLKNVKESQILLLLVLPFSDFYSNVSKL
jgi:hypothetical protein